VRNAPGYQNRSKSSIVRHQPAAAGYRPFCVLLEKRVTDRERLLLEQLRVLLV